MKPSEVTEAIREYTGNGYGIKLDDVTVAQYVIYDVIGFILGLITFFIVVGVGLITALDIAYITIPMFQDKVRAEKWDGSRGYKVRFISNDARDAVDEAATKMNGKTALGIYLRKRVKSYMICGVVLYICIVGSSTIVPIIANIVLQILKVFKSIHL